MNERIKELLIKSGFATGYDRYHTGKWKLTDSEVEKFAELIVKECLEWCDAHATIDGTAQQVRDSIKQHFGIEE